MLKIILLHAKKIVVKTLLTIFCLAYLSAFIVVALANGLWWIFSGRGTGDQWVEKFMLLLDDVMEKAQDIRLKISQQ